MSKRSSILNTLAEKFKVIDGTNYTSNINNNSFAKLKFWDEVSNFPSIYMSPGTELREYLPGDFVWVHLNVCIKVYCKGDTATDQLEQLLEDIESVIDTNRVLVYDSTSNYETTDMSIMSITTDEGLLAPYAVGEINLQVKYQRM